MPSRARQYRRKQCPFDPRRGQAHWSHRRWSLLGSAALVLGACTDGDSSAGKPSPGDGGIVREAGEPRTDLEIATDPESLKVTPGMPAALAIQVSPPGRYEVRFSLIGDSGRPTAAFLDRGADTTDQQGRASVLLTVPVAGEHFTLRVTVEGVSQDVRVDTLDASRATLLVEPIYQGLRPVEEWIVTTSQTVDCNDNDYEDYVEDYVFPVDEPIRLPNILAETPTQVLIRAKEYLFGCKEVELVPGMDNVIAITMADRPIQLAAVGFPLALGFERINLPERLELVIEEMLRAFHGESGDETSALLHAMQGRFIDPPAFELAAKQRDWHVVTRQHLLLRGGSENLLQEQLGAWLTGGADLFFTPEVLSGYLRSLMEAPTQGEFTLTTFAGLTPMAVSLPERAPVTLEADSQDILLAGFDLQFQPSQLLANMAAGVYGKTPAEGLVPELQTSLDCSSLAASLAAAGAQPSADAGASVDCPEECLKDLCEQGIGDLWSAAAEANLRPAVLAFTAAGTAQLDATARPLGFAGVWAGQALFEDDVEPVAVRGPFTSAPESASE